MVRLGGVLWGAVVWAAAAGVARAEADKPIYAPPAAWVKPATIPDRPPATDGSPVQTLLVDEQTFLGPDGDQQYGETAYRIITPQGLGPSGSVVMTWRPDTEVLTIHKAQIIRGGKVIDLLAGGKTFTVLRRETNLEMAMLDGALTATLQPEGLQVGDVIDLATTLTRRDPALQGFSEDYNRLGHTGVAARVRYREVWPDAKPMRWKATEGLPTPTTTHKDGQTELTFDMTDVSTPKAPMGAPGRFQQLGDVQVTQFADWAQLSALMAPLYDKAVTLAPNSPLRAEAARIAASTKDPKARAMAALKLVQEQVRYLFLGMDDGGYVPADADTTWTRRFGDCKAKTALLVALLRQLGIDAQPALVNAFGADGLDQRLPSIRAFNHVIVRAVIGGKVYWLDGARTGDRALDDIRIPQFDWALPVQASGGALARLERQPLAQPSVISTLTVDASHGFDAKATVRMRIDYYGEEAMGMREGMAKLTTADAQRQQREYWNKQFPWLEVSDATAAFDDAKGVMHMTMTGSGQMEWLNGETNGSRYYRVPSTTMGYDANFRREPGPNQDAPFALPFPLYVEGVTTITLPTTDRGRFVLLGEDVDVSLAGEKLTRTSRVEGGAVTITIDQRSLGREVAAAQARADAVQLRQMGQTGVTIVYDPSATKLSASASGASGGGSGGSSGGGAGGGAARGGGPEALLAAAQNGRADAQRTLAEHYLNGEGVPLDAGQARSWLQKAADQGDVDAEFKLAQLYADGVGGEKSDAKAFALFSRAAATGDHRAETAVGYAYQHGLSVQADMAAAIAWYHKAADKGYAGAQGALGMVYCCSTAPKDEAEAVRWFRKAADQGARDAQDNLGIMYRNGRGVPQDNDEARRWFEQSAAQGYAPAENSLGVIYSGGIGVPLQNQVAAGWFRKAADQGLASAEFNLAGIYASGQGLPLDSAQAAYWYRKAAQQGDTHAQEQLDRLKQKGITPASAPIAAPLPPPTLPPVPHRADDAASFDLRGRSLEGRDLDEALKAFDQAVAMKPDDSGIRLDRARALMRKGDDAKALDDLDHALATDPRSEAAHLARGEVYARTGRGAQAIDDFTTAVLQAPRDPEPLKSRAEAYAVARHYPLAVIDLTAAIALAPRRADLLEERSQAYRFQSNLSAARSDLDAAIALQPSAIAYFLRSSLRAPTDVAGARTDLDQALWLKPDYGAALEARAQLAIRSGDLAQAAKDYERGLRVTPDAGGFLEREAVAYESAGQYALSVATFDTLIARRPGHARDLSNRCWTKAAWGQQLQGAVADCDAALALSPDDGTAMFNRGYAHLRLGQLDAAIADFTAAVQSGPKVAASLYGRGVARRRKGQTAEGDGDLAAAKAIDPQIGAELARGGLVP